MSTLTPTVRSARRYGPRVVHEFSAGLRDPWTRGALLESLSLVANERRAASRRQRPRRVNIPDPGEQEACCWRGLEIKSAGMMSSDYLAYQGDSTDDKEKKWQFINKTGSLWSGNAVIEIENFVRGGNPEKPNQGEPWRCNFDSSPEFRAGTSRRRPASRYVASFTNGAVDFDGEEPGDEVYFERGAAGFNDGGNRRVMKWSLETSPARASRRRRARRCTGKWRASWWR